MGMGRAARQQGEEQPCGLPQVTVARKVCFAEMPRLSWLHQFLRETNVDLAQHLLDEEGNGQPQGRVGGQPFAL